MKLRLRVTPPRGMAFDFVAERPVVAIGRDPAGDLSFTDAMDNVSWEHAKIKVSDRAATLLDLDSTNGTFLNGSPTRLKTCALKIGDEFQLGQTGPKVRILELTLNNQPLTETPPRNRAAAHSQPKTPIRNNAPYPGSAGVSHTRALLIETQTRGRRLITAMAALFFVLILLIASAVWLIDQGNKGNAKTIDDSAKKAKEEFERLAKETADASNKIDNVVSDVKSLAQTIDDTTKRNQDQREEDRKRIELAKSDAQRMNQEMLEEIRRKGQVAVGDRPVDDLNALNRARGGNAIKDEVEPPLELTPGLVLSIRLRGSTNNQGADYRNSALATATSDALYLKHLDVSKDKRVSIEDIETLFVKNQMYSFNADTKQFEPGLAYFRLNGSSGTFMRVPRQDVDLSLQEPGVIDGETSTACFLIPSPGKTLILPKKRFGSMQFEAKAIAIITTNRGVYVWDEGKHEYEFKQHTQIAKELSDERDRKAKDMREDEYKKKVERYNLLTERLKALRPYWWQRF